jgi:hypothetical protein
MGRLARPVYSFTISYLMCLLCLVDLILLDWCCLLGSLTPDIPRVSLVDCILFLIGSMYFVAGSYEEERLIEVEMAKKGRGEQVAVTKPAETEDNFTSV